MPAYVSGPFNPPLLVQKGVAAYLFGSLNTRQDNTYMLVSQVAIATNVATLTVQITRGEIPVVGALISVAQTVTSSGAFNVTRAVLTGVTINATTGAGTVTYALTSGNVSTTADPGSAVVEVPEIGETLAAGASIPCVIAAPDDDSQFTVPISVTFPGAVLPTAVTVTLQAAIHDNASEYTAVGSAIAVVAGTAYTSGPFNQVTLQRGYFYRLLISGLTIGSATGIVAKIGG